MAIVNREVIVTNDSLEKKVSLMHELGKADPDVQGVSPFGSVDLWKIRGMKKGTRTGFDIFSP